MGKKKVAQVKEVKRAGRKIPNFTGSLDAKVPAENIVYVDHIAETGRWYAVSEGHDGGMFTAHAVTEPTARRAAGLRTLAHLEGLAKGEFAHATKDEVAAARLELIRVLAEAAVAVEGFNGDFPESRSREIVVFQLVTAKEVAEKKASRGLLARYIGPVACFLAGGYADGILGKLGERTLELLDKVLAG
jgi:hypothetical protein